MAIFRGTGGAGSGNNDATVTAVTTKANEAATSATAASGSASSAASSATASANSASTSSTKASEASTSKDTATTKASEASSSATAAANSATASANSATASANSATAAANAVPQDELAATGSPTFAAITINGNITVSGTVDGRDLQTDGTKLNGIEANATADQTNAEIRAAVEAATDSNVFTDADHTKLNGIEASATADQTNDEIKAAVEAASDSNTFTDADHTKLNGITASANNYVHPNHSGEVTSTADGATVIASNIVDEDNLKISNSPSNGYFLSAQSGNSGGLTWAAQTTYSVGDGGLTSNDFTDADHTKLNGIAASANNYVHPNHSGEVTSTADGATVIASNIVDEDNLKISNSAVNGYVLTAQSGNSGGLTWAASGSDVVSDTTPQLGGDLDLNSNDITGTGDITITGTVGVTTVDLGDWTITEASGVLKFAHSGTNKMKLDSSGNLTVVGDVTAYGTM